ncbi:MAG: DUF4199 domain-containing protein [Petrimonas sp.]|nr:DUF4199 domain-containing protein [Petrimonas sp.]
MQEDKSQLINFAMTGGFVLGGFWILKYLFVIGSVAYPFLNYVQSFLSIGTPILLFYFLVKYKNNIVKTEISFWHGVQFGIMLFFFASLLEAVIVIVHVIWIDPAFIANTYDNMLKMAESLPIDKKMLQMAKDQPLPTPFAYTFNMVMGNVLIGIILSLLIVPLATRFQVRNKD